MTKKKEDFESPLSKGIRLFCSKCDYYIPSEREPPSKELLQKIERRTRPCCDLVTDGGLARMKLCIYCALLFGYEETTRQ